MFFSRNRGVDRDTDRMQFSRFLHGRQAHFATLFKVEHFDAQSNYQFALLQIMTFTFFF